MSFLNNNETYDVFHEMSMSNDYGEMLYGKILKCIFVPLLDLIREEFGLEIDNANDIQRICNDTVHAFLKSSVTLLMDVVYMLQKDALDTESFSEYITNNFKNMLAEGLEGFNAAVQDTETN